MNYDNFTLLNKVLSVLIVIFIWKLGTKYSEYNLNVLLLKSELENLREEKKRNSTQVAEIAEHYRNLIGQVIEYSSNKKLQRKIIIPGKEINFIFTDHYEYLHKWGPSFIDIKTISLNDSMPKLIHRITVENKSGFWITDTPYGDNYSQGYGTLAANEFLLLTQKYGDRKKISGFIGFSDNYRHRQVPFYKKLGFDVTEDLKFHLDLATYKPIEDIDQKFIEKRIKWYDEKKIKPINPIINLSDLYK